LLLMADTPLRLEGGKVLRGRYLSNDSLYIDGDVVVQTLADGEAVDTTGFIVAPGFVDLQINGALGHDFTLNPETMGEVAAWLPSTGVTSFLPTVITTSGQRYENAMAAFRRSESTGARILGLHFEGPMLSVKKRGTHMAEFLRPLSEDELDAWTPANGVRLVTVAPELPGALDAIRQLVDQNVVVSMGHSAATTLEAEAGILAGATMVTHLFNAMTALDHREPGLVGTALMRDSIKAGIIVDGIHLHPDVVALAHRVLGVERFVLVTDAMAALGMAGDHFKIGPLEVTVDNGGVRNIDGHLAGSTLAMDQAVRNLIEFTGCSVEDALQSASCAPSSVIKAQNLGALFSGNAADLVLLSEGLEVIATMVAGEFVYDRR
jgi:N-acetylglucosamine-6-phosphate deacetylase